MHTKRHRQDAPPPPGAAALFIGGLLLFSCLLIAFVVSMGLRKSPDTAPPDPLARYNNAPKGTVTPVLASPQPNWVRAPKPPTSFASSHASGDD